MGFKPPLPPRVQANAPTDPFEAWLYRQGVNGHDRHWLRRNRTALHKKFTASGGEDLPIPAPTEKRRDRYDELY